MTNAAAAENALSFQEKKRTPLLDGAAGAAGKSQEVGFAKKNDEAVLDRIGEAADGASSRKFRAFIDREFERERKETTVWKTHELALFDRLRKKFGNENLSIRDLVRTMIEKELKAPAPAGKPKKKAAEPAPQRRKTAAAEPVAQRQKAAATEPAPQRQKVGDGTHCAQRQKAAAAEPIAQRQKTAATAEAIAQRRLPLGGGEEKRYVKAADRREVYTGACGNCGVGLRLGIRPRREVLPRGGEYGRQFADFV